jgi:hypothetical protein
MALALWWSLAELLALTGFVVAQPLLNATGQAPDFFLLRRVERGQILLLVAMIALLPPLALWVVELLARLVGGERLHALAHWAIMAGLLILLTVEDGKKVLPLRARRLLAAAFLAGLVFAWLYRRWAGLKLWLRYLAPAPLVFALLFAVTSPTSKLVLPGRPGAASSHVPALTRPGTPLPPVVIVLFDEFPLQSLLDSKGEIDRRVYPNFADLAAHSTWYRNATTVNAWTPYAVPALMSGRYPQASFRGSTPNLASYPDNLFTLFGHFYNLKVFETVTELCPKEKCGQTGTPSGFGTVVRQVTDLYRQIAAPVEATVDPADIGSSPIAASAGGSSGDQGPMAYFGNLGQDQVARVDKFLATINATDQQPTLYFLHVLLPHAPWKFLPDGRLYNAGTLKRPVFARGVWPAPLVQLNHERHLLQVAYTDQIVGKVVARLKQQGLWDKSLVVMTADHGNGFSYGDPSRSLGRHNAAELLWVPLFIKTPHQATGRVDDRNWEHVDLLPTIADIAGLTIPWQVDGFSETGPPKRLRTDKWFYSNPGSRQVVSGPQWWPLVLHGVTDTLIKAHQNGERGFYQIGATADWVYQPVTALGRVAGAPLQAKIADWGGFATIDPRSAVVPVLLTGTVTSGAPPPGATMVVAVNGRVAATAAFYPAKPGDPMAVFATLLPPFLFTPGPGHAQIRLYVATRTASGYNLQPVTIPET